MNLPSATRAPFPLARWRDIPRWVCAISLSAMVTSVGSCGGGPTAPNSSVPTLQVTCPGVVLVGQPITCVATALVGQGRTQNVSVSASWSTNDPAIATIDLFGLLRGRSAGQVIVSASYGGTSASTQVAVEAQDVLQVTSAAIQGIFSVGNAVMMAVQGYYGVASAGTGSLALVITDQNGTVVASSPPKAVPRGGDGFVLSDTFTIPIGTTQVCRTAVLQIGSITLTSTGSSELFPCVAVGQ